MEGKNFRWTGNIWSFRISSVFVKLNNYFLSTCLYLLFLFPLESSLFFFFTHLTPQKESLIKNHAMCKVKNKEKEEQKKSRQERYGKETKSKYYLKILGIWYSFSRSGTRFWKFAARFDTNRCWFGTECWSLITKASNWVFTVNPSF